MIMANDTISSRDITIVASVCGVVIVILLIVLVYFCCRFKQPKKNSEANSSALRHSHQTLNSSSNYHNVVSVQDHVQSCGYQPVATLCSPTTTDCRFEESSTLGRGADSPLKAASVGGKPYALVTPHPSQQQLHFDNMALSPSDPYGKMFATNQSARDPLDSNQVYRLNMTTDFSQEQYLAGLMTSSGQKAKKVSTKKLWRLLKRKPVFNDHDLYIHDPPGHICGLPCCRKDFGNLDQMLRQRNTASCGTAHCLMNTNKLKNSNNRHEGAFYLPPHGHGRFLKSSRSQQITKKKRVTIEDIPDSPPIERSKKCAKIYENHQHNKQRFKKSTKTKKIRVDSIRSTSSANTARLNIQNKLEDLRAPYALEITGSMLRTIQHTKKATTKNTIKKVPLDKLTKYKKYGAQVNSELAAKQAAAAIEAAAIHAANNYSFGQRYYEKFIHGPVAGNSSRMANLYPRSGCDSLINLHELVSQSGSLHHQQKLEEESDNDDFQPLSIKNLSFNSRNSSSTRQPFKSYSREEFVENYFIPQWLAHSQMVRSDYSSYMQEPESDESFLNRIEAYGTKLFDPVDELFLDDKFDSENECSTEQSYGGVANQAYCSFGDEIDVDEYGSDLFPRMSPNTPRISFVQSNSVTPAFKLSNTDNAIDRHQNINKEYQTFINNPITLIL